MANNHEAEQALLENGNNIDDEDLGSELSGMSVEIPVEIKGREDSGTYLEFYYRDYKHGELVNRRKQRAEDAPKGFRFSSQRDKIQFKRESS